MAQYMLLFYADEPSREAAAAREELPKWVELIGSLREEGVFLGTGRLQPVDSATTLRVRDGETEITDGPFATTKEILGGYMLLECADLDEALALAARVPLARYGSVEVRPMMELPVASGEGRPAA